MTSMSTLFRSEIVDFGAVRNLTKHATIRTLRQSLLPILSVRRRSKMFYGERYSRVDNRKYQLDGIDVLCSIASFSSS